MFLKAVCAIQGPRETYKPGDIFQVADDEGKRLIEAKAATSVRKTISIQVPLGRKVEGKTNG